MRSGPEQPFTLESKIDDAEDDRKVLITNLPYENPENADEEKLVGEVAAPARVVHRPKAA